MQVTYKVISIPGLLAQETGYQLSTGDYAAVSFSKGDGAAPDMFSIRAKARAVRADGSPVLATDGGEVHCIKHVSAPKSSLVSGVVTGPAIRDRVLEAVINDPDGLVAELAANSEYAKIFAQDLGDEKKP